MVNDMIQILDILPYQQTWLRDSKVSLYLLNSVEKRGSLEHDIFPIANKAKYRNMSGHVLTFLIDQLDCFALIITSCLKNVYSS